MTTPYQPTAIDTTSCALHTVSYVARIISIALFVLALLFILPAITPHIKNAHQYSYIRNTLKFERSISHPILSNMRKYIPTKIRGKDISRWILVILTLLLWERIGTFSRKLSARAQFRSAKLYLANLKVGDRTPPGVSSKVQDMKQQMEALGAGKRNNHKALLKQFVALKKELDASGKTLTFLAIDVVNSTKMKIGEEKAVVEYDFDEYNNLVKKILDQHGCLTSSWTPDGVMSCFPSVEPAVQAARALISNLEDFNKNVKQIKKDFSVRCGINSGFVYYDPSTPLELFSDRVIDIAGHMQKDAKPNTVYIAKETIEPVIERTGFKTAKLKVDGLDVYEWQLTQDPDIA